MKLLVVASEPIDETAVDLITRDETPDEVRVIAPTLTGSALRYWMNDTDNAIAHSERVIARSMARLEEVEVAADAAPVTDDQPAVTIDDALREFDPDRILVVKHAATDEAYREDEIVQEIARHTDAPVEVHSVESND
jgi:pyruvate/oxaloacetate carboxyltransferase